MSRALLRSSFRGVVRPPLLGAAYMATVALWAARNPTLDERAAGAQARQIDAVVHGYFGAEIQRMAVAVVATAIVLGALLGWSAAALVALRDRLGAPYAGPTRSHARYCLIVLGLVVSLHAVLELCAMAQDPQLYASAWYENGGWRRTVQVLATDVLGPTGVLRAAVLACALFLTGPPSRWPLWPERASRAADRVGARCLALLHGSGGARRALALALSVGTAVVLFALAIAHTPAARAQARGDPRPNIVVIAADSLRADRLDPRTAPHLSALAARGTRFDRAYVSLPRTFPSWVTLLTGRHPHHHGIRSMFPRWEERARDFDALPERLSRAGWSTAVVSDYAGDVFSRIDLGFGTVDVPEFDFRQLVRQRVLERETPLLPVLDSRLGRAAFPVIREMNDAADPALLARRAVGAMRSLEARAAPFFLLVFFSTAHFPYAAPAPYYGRFTDPAYRGRFKYFKRVGLGHEMPANLRDQQQVRGLYDGAVAAIDDAAQSIVDAMRRDRIDERTIVVVTADHGETLFDHGHGQGHGDHLFGDEGTHVPLAIIDPRSPVPHREPAVVRDVDLAPTLYGLAGVAPPADLDGRSLEGAIRGGTPAPALAYAETGLWFTEDIPGMPADLRLPYPGIARLTEIDTAHSDDIVLRQEMRPLTIVAKHRMVRDERWKLLYVPTRTGVRWMLFDTAADPGEEHDVAAAHPEIVARLEAALWAWMRRDPDMTERNGYLVPRGAGAAPPMRPEGVRLDDVALRGSR